MKQFPFYDDLSKGAKALLSSHAIEVTIPSKMELFFQGEQCKDILFLTGGCLPAICIRTVCTQNGRNGGIN